MFIYHLKAEMHRSVMKSTYVVISFCISSAIGYLSPDSMIGPGRWIVEHIKKCPDAESYPFQFDVRRHKVNRTHDGFSGEMRMDAPLDSTYAVRVDVCKHVDGGCKPYAVLTDESFCHFIDKFAKDNVESVFQQSGLPLPYCPIPSGTHKIADYMFDYTELHDTCVYGLFDARTVVLDVGGAPVSCVDVTVRFDKNDD